MRFDLAYVRELLRDIERYVSNQQRPAADAALSVLADLVVAALKERDDANTRNAYDEIEKCFSGLVTKVRPDDPQIDERSVVEELGAYTRLLDVALRRDKPLGETILKLTSADRQIMDALLGNRSGLSGVELSRRTEITPEHIARRLPLLRELGLVESQRAGKSTINTLSHEARVFLTAPDLSGPTPRSTAAKEPRINKEVAVRPVQFLHSDDSACDFDSVLISR